MTHVIVVDLGYGDAGKGTVVDWLCAVGPAHAVVRFNGGAQAGHNVLTPGGRHHTFAQFGSELGAGRTHPPVAVHARRPRSRSRLRWRTWPRSASATRMTGSPSTGTRC